MSDVVKIKKGLDLPIAGAAERRTSDARSIRTYAVKPADYVGLVPRLLVAEGDRVKAGDPLLCDKQDDRIRFTSPVDGTVKAVVRGAKRLLLAVVVEADGSAQAAAPNQFIEGSIKERMLQCGLWTRLIQRPFGTVPSPDAKPKAMVVSCFDSAPLAPDYDYVLQGREEDFCRGLEALTELFDGDLHLGFRPQQRLAAVVASALRNSRVKTHFIDGPHPAGNVGTQIARFCPINKGESVWTMGVQDVVVLGRLARTGEYRPERVVAVAGPSIRNPHYYRTTLGACVTSIVEAQRLNPAYPLLQRPDSGDRIISGNVLSGSRIEADGFLGANDSLLTFLPEGNYYDFMGWLIPTIRRFSFSRTFASGFLSPATCCCGMKMPRFEGFWKFDTNTHGDVRPLVFTGSFERVFPFDIYPTQLIKACIVGDIELMENLGIYEVEPEDFALCEFIDTSKTDIQPIIREALEKLRKEAV